MSEIKLQNASILVDVSLSISEAQARGLLALALWFDNPKLEDFLKTKVGAGAEVRNHEESLIDLFTSLRVYLPDALKQIEDARRVLTGQVSLPAAPRAANAPTAAKQPKSAT